MTQNTDQANASTAEVTHRHTVKAGAVATTVAMACTPGGTYAVDVECGGMGFVPLTTGTITAGEVESVAIDVPHSVIQVRVTPTSASGRLFISTKDQGVR